MQDLRVTLVQSDTVWHDPETNLKSLESLISPHLGKTDIVVLPEMFSTGFTMASSDVAETMQGPTINWMQRMAVSMESAICGSLVIEEKNNYFNRFIWVEPAGAVYYYDKRHLFRMANEHDFYTAGSENICIEYKGWKIRPAVCYDLRFPVWARNEMINDTFAYDILIYVANWPEVRVLSWDTLLKARAMENHAYTIGVNRTGRDSNNIKYNGHSAAYDPRGTTLKLIENDITASTVSLSYASLEQYRQKFPAQLDADPFIIKK